MYLINVKSLAQKIKDNHLSQREEFSYYLNLLLLIVTYNHVSGQIPNDTSKEVNILLFILTIFIMGFGITSCFKINSKGDNKNFISRMTCLSFPLTIQIILLKTMLIFLFIFLVNYIPVFNFVRPYGWLVEIILSSSILIYFYSMLRSNIRFIATS